MKIPEFSRAWFFGFVLLFGLLAMTARPATDPDLWWHLRTGQWIVETGHVPHADPFSFTRAGQPWVVHEWMSEVLFYELWKHAGFAALIVFSAIITTAGFILLYWRCLAGGVKKHSAAAAIVLGALAAAPSWGVRPQIFTFMLASLLLWLIERGESRPRILFWIPPLFLLWLNLHAGFALAPVLLLAYGAGLMIETAIGATPWKDARPIILRVVLLLVACVVLVPLNPSGAELYRYPFDTLRSPAMRSLIGEWHSPDFHEWLYRPFLLVWLLLFVAFASSRSRPKWRMTVPLLLTACAALDAVRHIPIFVLLAVPVIAAAVSADSASLTVADSDRRPISSRLRPFFNGVVVILMAAFALVRWVSLGRGQDAREAEQYPQKTVAFLRTGDFPKNVFVYYDWGGYAIWKLYPEYRVFVDGRADLYGDDHLSQFTTAVQLRTGWREVLDRWKIEAVLVPPACALAQALLLDPNWHTAFREPKAILLVRSEAAVAHAGVPHMPVIQRPTAGAVIGESRR
ncbi:MAG: hypothetical protein ACLPLR_14145 [Terriglobales bacterium]